MFVFCMVTGHFINNNVISIIAQIFVGIVSYFLVLSILKDEFFNKIFSSITSKLHKKEKDI